MSYPIKGATVLVTGGAGLVGSHIVDQLIDAGAGEIRVLDNLTRGRLENLAEACGRFPVQVIEADVRDREAVGRAVADCDYVFHQAAIRITRCAEQPRECLDVLATGTMNVFEAAVAAGVKKVVYASSASVYGGAEDYPTTEKHHPYNNRTLYGAAKLFTEGMAHHYHDMQGLATVGLRYFNVYGPRMDMTGVYTEVMVRWLDAADRAVPPQIHGDGSASMDFVYITDVARANLLALRSDQDDTVYNVASGTETSLLQLWQTIQSAAGAQGLTPEFLPPRKVNAVPRRLADTSRARQELGFTAEVPLLEGLRRLAAWRREMRAAKELAV